MKEAIKKSWKTTASAVMAAFASIAANSAALLDSDPETLADWTVTVPLVILAVGLVFARDSDVTSEQSGAKKVA